MHPNKSAQPCICSLPFHLGDREEVVLRMRAPYKKVCGSGGRCCESNAGRKPTQQLLCLADPRTGRPYMNYLLLSPRHTGPDFLKANTHCSEDGTGKGDVSWRHRDSHQIRLLIPRPTDRVVPVFRATAHRHTEWPAAIRHAHHGRIKTSRMWPVKLRRN